MVNKLIRWSPESKNSSYEAGKSSSFPTASEQKTEHVRKSVSDDIIYSVRKVAQLQVKDRIHSLNIHTDGTVKGVNEKGVEVLVENKIDQCPAILKAHNPLPYLEQLSYTLTQRDDGTYVLRGSAVGYGGGTGGTKGARPKETKPGQNEALVTYLKESACYHDYERIMTELKRLIKNGANINFTTEGYRVLNAEAEKKLTKIRQLKF